MLHSCLAIMPAFASEAYFINKGSSSVAASLISGTPLVATPRLLAAYTFLDAASVYLIPEGVPDADAMQAIMALPPELLTAKVASVERLRRHVYDRNLALLQLALGDQYLFKRRIGKSDSASADAGGKGKHVKEVVAMWYDGGGPIWTAE